MRDAVLQAGAPLSMPMFETPPTAARRILKTSRSVSLGPVEMANMLEFAVSSSPEEELRLTRLPTPTNHALLQVAPM